MIRLKSKDADLKQTYARDLWASVGLVVLLLAVVVAIDPQIVFDPLNPVQRPVIIELELVPETEMRLPLPPPPVRRIEPVAYVRTRPVREHKLPPPVVVTEFPLEEEVEAAELWMVEQPPKVLKKILPVYPDSARQAQVEGKVFARVLVGRKGRVEHIDRIEGPQVFQRAVAQAAKAWEFSPAVQNDRAVPVWVSLPFVFELE
ncbi:MAG: energy transducer TonB [Gemmatimonadetes bacterium]|nr:energy transducer TonB [Gemmatimonadota bacterium]